LAVSFEHLAVANDNSKAAVLGRTLDDATDLFLRNDKSPSRKVHELDNRGSHFYLALYWAQALGDQTEDADLQAAFAPIAAELASNEESIVREMIDVQGPAADLGGYYLLDEEKTSAVMRPSSTFNAIIAKLG
jgi:isocitrate dehydrogenase